MNEIVPSGDAEEMKEFREWLNNNKTAKVSEQNFYGTPRISSEYPDCSMPICCDIYNFCSASCSYCFSYFQKSNNPSVVRSKTGLELKSGNFTEFKNLLKGKSPNNVKYYGFLKKRKVLQIGSMSDPFDAVFEPKNNICYKFVELFNEYVYPVRWCSKIYPNPKLIENFDHNKQNKNYAFMYSIVTTNKDHANKLEYGASVPEKRFEALKLFHDMGYYTMIRLRPFIMGTSDLSLDTILAEAKKAGVNSLSVEWYCMESRANPKIKKMHNWLSKTVGFDYVDYARQLTPSKRGGYLRANRDVKEPYIRKIYQFCLANDIHFACSDPDYKELNFSSSCCGLPELEKNRWHPDLSNFIRSQWTYLLRNARINFWKKNSVDDVLNNDYEDEEIIFDMLESQQDAEWLKDRNVYSGDFVEASSHSAGYRAVMTPLESIKRKWNETRKYSSPVNYFNGKVVSKGIDKNNNIIYKYNPMPYEIIWQTKYGIDLSKN